MKIPSIMFRNSFVKLFIKLLELICFCFLLSWFEVNFFVDGFTALLWQLNFAVMLDGRWNGKVFIA
jgi:hypothetical protein